MYHESTPIFLRAGGGILEVLAVAPAPTGHHSYITHVTVIQL